MVTSNIKITINCDGSEMTDNFYFEGARIFKKLAKEFEKETIIFPKPIIDINGNVIGEINLIEEEI